MPFSQPDYIWEAFRGTSFTTLITRILNWSLGLCLYFFLFLFLFEICNLQCFSAIVSLSSDYLISFISVVILTSLWYFALVLNHRLLQYLYVYLFVQQKTVSVVLHSLLKVQIFALFRWNLSVHQISQNWLNEVMAW